MKKFIAMLLAFVMVLGLAACGGTTTEATEPQGEGEQTATTIKVAAIETAYGSQVWADVAAAFTAETGIEVELTTDKNLEDVLSGPMQNGEFPDVVPQDTTVYTDNGSFDLHLDANEIRWYNI